MSGLRERPRIEVNLDLMLECLAELADEALQKDLWLAKIPGKMSTYNEAICGLFNDSALDSAWDRGQIEFSPIINAKLIKLGSLASKLSRDEYHMKTEDFIASPGMTKLRAMAREVLNAIRSFEAERKR